MGTFCVILKVRGFHSRLLPDLRLVILGERVSSGVACRSALFAGFAERPLPSCLSQITPDDSDDDPVCDQPFATPRRSTTCWCLSPSDIHVEEKRQQCQVHPADGAADRNPWAEMAKEGGASMDDAWHAARFQRCVLDAELKCPIRARCSDILGDSEGGSFQDRMPSNNAVGALWPLLGLSSSSSSSSSSRQAQKTMLRAAGSKRKQCYEERARKHSALSWSVCAVWSLA